MKIICDQCRGVLEKPRVHETLRAVCQKCQRKNQHLQNLKKKSKINKNDLSGIS